MISQLGRYEIICEIGQGAMGIVYRARDPLIDRVVAIKTINLRLALDEKEEYEARFNQEARAAGRLNHPNIVTIYDLGKNDDVAYIAMEYLQGRELRDMMNYGGLLPMAQALDIAAQVAEGLSYAHEHEIVHRDIKPANIMVARDGRIKITDFGIARMASSAIHTQTGIVLGSPKYMSPEQVMGKTVDQRSDIFSLGVVLYEMLLRKAPFTGDDINAIMFQTLKATPIPPSTLNDAIPEMVDFIIAKALAKTLEDRYQNAHDFAVDLRACSDFLQQREKSAVAPPLRNKPADTLDVSGRYTNEAEEPIPAASLSPLFDSNEATLRLAALTAPTEDLDKFSRNLANMRNSAETVTHAGPTVKVSNRDMLLITIMIMSAFCIIIILFA